MPAQVPAVTGLVCTGDETLGRAVALLMHASGLRVLAVADSVDDAIGVARASRPEAIFLDVAAFGIRGLAVLPVIVDAAPESAVTVYSPFPALAEAVLASGASAVVDPSDLRPLLPVLAGVRDAAHAGYACTCCNPPPRSTGSAAVFDPGASTSSMPEGAQGLLWDRSQGRLADGSGSEPPRKRTNPDEP